MQRGAQPLAAGATAPAQQQPLQQQQQQGSAVGLKEALFIAGLSSLAGMFYFYKRKQTVPFKTCYALSWPTMGGAIMLAVQPSPTEMEQRLEHSRAVTSADLKKQREANAATINAMMQQYSPAAKQQQERGSG